MGKPFSLARYELAPGLVLSLVAEHDAMVLGAMVASMEPWRSYPITSEQMTRFVGDAEPGAPRFAIRAEGLLVGTVAIRTNWLRGPYIQLLALAPTAQGRGIGARILAFVEQEANRGGERNLWVAATSTNAGALRFYERHGFVRLAKIEGLVSDGHSEVLLRKRLAS